MQFSESPLISVLLPVYNSELYIEEALQSVLNQTYTNFECIVIDDASTDKTIQIIEAIKDDRIILIKKETNTGYTKNLNEGIKLSKGKYIARMDGDDICFSDRFEKQVLFLEQNEDTVLCGSWYMTIPENKLIKKPKTNLDIKHHLLQQSAFGHPTVMIRTEVLKQNRIFYNSKNEPAEDYNLWVKLLDYGKLSNIQEPLLYYRIHNAQISTVKYTKARLGAAYASFKMLNKLGFKYTNNQKEIYISQFRNDKLLNEESVLDLHKLFTNVKKTNKTIQYFKKEHLSRFINGVMIFHLDTYFRRNDRYSLNMIKQYFYFKKIYKYKMNYPDFYKFLVKALISYNLGS